MTTVLVLAAPDDEGLSVLEPAPSGVRFAVGRTAGELGEAALEAEALFYCGGGREALADLLARSPRLRWVHSRPAGVDTLPLGELAKRGLPLTNSRGVWSAALADFALAALLYFARDIPRLRRSQAAGRWEPFSPDALQGRTLAVLGYGDIGRAVARRARPFGLEVLAVQRTPRPDPDGIASATYGLEQLGEVLARAHHVVAALPLTPETRAVLGREALAACRPDAVLVNVGRGPTVDEAALLEALRAGRLRGAALDVFAEEPLPAGHPFYALDNVLLSPHCADRVAGWREAGGRLFLDNLARFLAGQPLLNVVDPALAY